jgi:hypothetical protein
MSTVHPGKPGDPWSISSTSFAYPSADVTVVPATWVSWYAEATLFAGFMPLLMIALAAGSFVPGTSPRAATITGLIAAAVAWPFFAGIAGACRLVPEGVTRIGLRTLLLLPATFLVGLIVFLSGVTTGVYQLDVGI